MPLKDILLDAVCEVQAGTLIATTIVFPTMEKVLKS